MESINIYNVNGQSLMSVGIGQDCVYHNELQGEEYISLRWESDEYQTLPVGAYVNYNGRNYRLVEPCEPTRKTEFVYTYEPIFYATHCAWKKVQACYYEYLNSGITITNNTTTHKVSISVATSVTAREMDWSFTGNLPDALAMVLQSIYNETGLLVEFVYAEEIGNKLIELTAQGLSVYDMIEQLAEQCGKEWWVDYSQTTPVIHLATLEKTATPNAQNVDSNGVVLLNVGTDITNPSVQTNKDDYFTRFYFFGSNRNIQQSESITNSAVVNKRLTLNPKHQTEQGYTSLNHYPQGFIDINANITPDTDTNYQPTLANSEIYAKTVFLDDIYPRANYKVKEVKYTNIDVEDDTGKKTGEQLPIYFVTLYDANDAQHTAIGFNDWVGENASHVMGDMVAGLVPSIAFRGGYLQGLEFELIIHKAGTTTRGITFASDYFEIVFDQNSNPRLPNATIKPIANDDCTLFNVRMPNKYILNAYHELEAKALEYIEDAKTDKATYDITCNPIKFESVPALASLNIGYKSAIIYPNSARTDSRVVMIEKHLDIESDIKLQLGYRKTAGSIKTLQEVVTSTHDNVEKVVKTADYNRNKMIAMRTNLNAQREALENVFDPDGYFDSDKIRPMSIETQMLTVGAKSQQFAITGSSFKLPDYSSGHGILTWTAGTLNHFTIDESGVKNWTISAGTQNLANGNLYYVYAKCGKANTSATIVAEQTQRKFDADATYYYFLIGTISSESQDADNHLWGRVLTFTYGSAQINGREITAGVIKGGAGAHSVKIDLEEGVIEGNIKLTAGDTDNASIINALVDSNSTVATASENASTANDKIDNLEVGGRNLISLTDIEWSNNADTASWKRYNMPNVPLANGDYMLSFDVKTSNGTDVFYAGLGETDSTRIAVERIKPTTSYTRMFVKIVNSGSYSINSVIVSNAKAYGRGNDNNIGTLYINNVKLEKGNKATDWTPAPEDTQSGIDLANLEGTCNCAHSQQSGNAFTVECNQFKSSYLKKGTRIRITMALENHNSYRGTFNVNNTGAKELLWQKSTGKSPIWEAGEVVPFIYDGTQWIIEDEEQRILKQVYSEASDGSTSVSGGLILTKMVQCGEGATQAGISGLLSSIVAFWAGGNHAQASRYESPVVIMRDGNAKFGLLRINNQGSITVPNTDGYSRLNIFDGNLPNPTSSAVKINTHIHSSGTTAGGGSSTLYVNGTTMSSDYNGQVANANPAPAGSMLAMKLTDSQRASIQFNVSLKCGLNEEYIVTHNDYDTYEQGWAYYKIKPTSCAYKHGSGSTNISVKLNIVGGVSGNIEWKMTGSATNSGIQLEFNGDATVPKTNLASNGLQVLLNASNYFEAKQVGSDLITTIRGKLKAPGLLWAGRIVSGSTATKMFACEGVSCTVSVSDTSLYTITISGVKSEPVVTATPFVQGVSARGWSAMVNSLSFSGTTATIKIRTTSDNTNTACAFYLAVYGEPA